MYNTKVGTTKQNIKAFCMLAIIILCIGALLWMVSPFQYFFEIYTSRSNIFRLSKQEVEENLYGKELCPSVTACPLQPGDILLRRYVTPKTRDFDTYIHPYFTHSAFYLGDGRIVEAVGTEKRREDEILVENISGTDWEDQYIEKLVVIRPHYTKGALSKVKANLITIADDPQYRFGLPKADNKMTTCADLIIKQLYLEEMIPVYNQPKIITPDYLFWVTVNDTHDFEIIRYTSISEK